MKMTVRQLSHLIDGEVVGEKDYGDDTPANFGDVFQLILKNCSDFLRNEGIFISQDSIELEKVVFSYPSLAGIIEVTFGD